MSSRKYGAPDGMLYRFLPVRNEPRCHHRLGPEKVGRHRQPLQGLNIIEGFHNP